MFPPLVYSNNWKLQGLLSCWDVILYSLADGWRCFEGSCCHLRQSRRITFL